MATEKQIEKRNKLLRRVIEHIKEEPLRLDMEVWENSKRTMGKEGSEYPVPPCGTTACIFGWANLLNRKNSERPEDIPYFRSAIAELLSITLDEAAILVHSAYWPPRYKAQYNSATTAKGRMQVTIRRIEAFIKSNGEV